jgi:hypothetical protein
MRIAPDGDSPSIVARSRERLEARLAAHAEAMGARNAEALQLEVARIRGEAAEHLSAQCRELVALSRAVAAAEREREGRICELEERLFEALAQLESSTPRPLDIPRARLADGPSVSELWRRSE